MPESMPFKELGSSDSPSQGFLGVGLGLSCPGLFSLGFLLCFWFKILSLSSKIIFMEPILKEFFRFILESFFCCILFASTTDYKIIDSNIMANYLKISLLEKLFKVQITQKHCNYFMCENSLYRQTAMSRGDGRPLQIYFACFP